MKYWKYFCYGVFVFISLLIVYMSLQVITEYAPNQVQSEQDTGEEPADPRKTLNLPDEKTKTVIADQADKNINNYGSTDALLYNQRLVNISNACTKRKTPQALTYIPKIMQNSVLIEQKHAILYCGIPKIGSTFWKRILTVLGSNGLYTSPFQFRLDGVKLTSLKKLKVQLTDSELETFLKNATSFMFVRDPYARLYSGYVNKLYHANNMFWYGVGRKVVLTIRKEASAESLQYGHDVTFAEFLKFILNSYDKNKNIDHHFAPINTICNPCLMPYDFIGKMETFQQDYEYLKGQWETEFSDFNITFVDFNKDAAMDTATGLLRFAFESKKKLQAIRYPFYNLILRTWSDLQIRGYISKYIPLSITRKAADNTTYDELVQAIEDAIGQTADKRSAKLQREEALIQAYRTVSVEDMERLRQFVLKDCQLFGYDDRPAALFDRARPYVNDHLYMAGL